MILRTILQSSLHRRLEERINDTISCISRLACLFLNMTGLMISGWVRTHISYNQMKVQYITTLETIVHRSKDFRFADIRTWPGLCRSLTSTRTQTHRHPQKHSQTKTHTNTQTDRHTHRQTKTNTHTHIHRWKDTNQQISFGVWYNWDSITTRTHRAVLTMSQQRVDLP